MPKWLNPNETMGKWVLGASATSLIGFFCWLMIAHGLNADDSTRATITAQVKQNIEFIQARFGVQDARYEAQQERLNHQNEKLLEVLEKTTQSAVETRGVLVVLKENAEKQNQVALHMTTALERFTDRIERLLAAGWEHVRDGDEDADGQ